MNRATARTVLLVIAAWVIGALEGSVVYRRHEAESPVRFEPGLYLIEEPLSGFQWAGRFEYSWSVRHLEETPRD